MLIFWALSLLLARANSECLLSDWSDWSEYEQLKYCGPAIALSSYPVSPVQYDSGRQMMTLSMMLKEEASQEMKRCKEDDSCFTFNERASMTGAAGYVPCVDNLAGEYPCLHIDQLSFVSIPDLVTEFPADDTNPRGNDIWGWTDPLNGDEYALMGLTGGTSFVRISDPRNPVPVAFVKTETTSTSWRDLKVIDNYVYIGAEGTDHGVQIFDLTRLRVIKTLTEMRPDVVYREVGNTHNIVSSSESKTIFAVGATQSAYTSCAGGLHAIDVSNPLQPKFAGCYDEDGYTHDAQCVIYEGPDARYFRREVCFNFNEDTITIVDVTNKADMKMISKVGYGGHAYTHQGWVSSDHSVLLCDDELDEMTRTQGSSLTNTYVWDIVNLERPELKTLHQSHLPTIDHNQYVKDGFTYQANYQSGLRVKHIDQTNYELNEVAYFDVFPERDLPTFAGSWSVYPYFPSGNVVISSIEFGLYTVRPDYAAMEVQAVAAAVPAVHVESTRHRDILSKGPNDTCPALLEIKSALLPPKC